MKIAWSKTGLDFSGEGLKEIRLPQRIHTSLGPCDWLELNCDSINARFIIHDKYYFAHEITEFTIDDCERIEGIHYLKISVPGENHDSYRKI